MALLGRGRPLSSSRKRPGAPSSATESPASGPFESASKRPRRLEQRRSTSPSSFSVDTAASPPLLEASTTFDSSSSSPTSLEEPPSLPPSSRLTLASDSHHQPPFETKNCNATSLLAIDNDAAVANIATHPSQYYTAISAAKARLRTAQLLAANSRTSLSRAQVEFESSRREVASAVEFLEGVERRWGVIDVDSDSSTVFDPAGGLDTASEVGNSTTIAATEREDAVEHSVRRIEVGNAGEALVNGRYKLCVASVDSNGADDVPRGLIYVHEDGPFDVQGESYDVCIFQKRGYGDKLRWCIALVPCQISEDENECEGEERARNFALAYVYYWMEVYATEANAACPPLDGEDGSSASWGACHGARPLPMLKDVTGRRWWQFWKR